MTLFAALTFAAAALAPAQSCQSARVIDGDTIACADGTHLRLSGIDAPELPGHCRSGRACAPGDPIRSRARLRRATRQPVTYQPLLRDLYGRTVAVVRSGSINLSCSQLRAHQAIYVSKWDKGGYIRSECQP